jgi:hypothetical protein
MRIAWNLAVVLVAAGALAAAAPGALASSQPAAGSFTETPETIISERLSGGNDFIHLTRDAFITGAYTGLGHADQYIVIHSDGSFNFHQTIAFSGVVCGQAVDLQFSMEGTGDFTSNTLHGTYSIVGPTPVGRGNGTVDSIPGVGGSYQGQVHCD